MENIEENIIYKEYDNSEEDIFTEVRSYYIIKENVYMYYVICGYYTDTRTFNFIIDYNNKLIIVENSRYIINENIKYDNFNYEAHKVDNTLSPYVRFPRSKDGIELVEIFNYMIKNIDESYKLIILNDYKKEDINKEYYEEEFRNIDKSREIKIRKKNIYYKIYLESKKVIIMNKNKIYKNGNLHGIIINKHYNRYDKKIKEVYKVVIQDIRIIEIEIPKCKKLKLQNVVINFDIRKFLLENKNIESLEIIGESNIYELDLKDTNIKEIKIKDYYGYSSSLEKIRINEEIKKAYIPDFQGYSDDNGWIYNINFDKNLEKIFYNVDDYKINHKISMDNFKLGGIIFSNYIYIEDYENIFGLTKLFICNYDRVNKKYFNKKLNIIRDYNITII